MAYKIPKPKKISYRTEPYNEDELASFGRKEGLSYDESLLFAKFMKRRFPQEKHSSYVAEWIERFKSGHPESYMDSESTKIYNEVKEVLK